MDEKQKKQLMIGGGIAGGLVLIGLLYMAFGRPSDDVPVDTSPGTATGAGTRGRPKQVAVSPDGQPLPEGAVSANPAPQGLNGKTVQVASVFPGRKKDPFYYERHIVPPPPNVFDQVNPITVAVENLPVIKVGPRIMRVVPNRRVSGLMSGDGVYAILEGANGDVEIVKPGSKTKDGYTVVAINPDSVLLEKEDPATKTTYTQTVMFSDAAVSSTPGGGRGGNGGPYGGGPGGGNGGPGGDGPQGPPPGRGDGGG